MAGYLKPTVKAKGSEMKKNLAIWVSDLEVMRRFYENYFNAHSIALCQNSKKSFSSYFLSFRKGPRLELMQKPEIPVLPDQTSEHMGIIHFAISVRTKEKVDSLTKQLRTDGFRVVGEP